ncbi:hypothetical protein [Streptomyces sp. NPDC005752]|uniref:hypothetical protein n=1 Tax=Streptomyces sp. NPDC005752 TaxID=3157065 RepID=UPI0033C2D6D8
MCQMGTLLNDTSVADFGTLALRGVRVTGQVLLARDAVRSDHVAVNRLVVEAADVRGRVERPHGFGADALQGAFTLWDQQPDQAVEITAELLCLSAGSADRPVRGSGVFVGGHCDWDGAADGGAMRVSTLRTGEIHTDGGIPAGTPDVFGAGVFVISGPRSTKYSPPDRSPRMGRTTWCWTTGGGCRRGRRPRR